MKQVKYLIYCSIILSVGFFSSCSNDDEVVSTIEAPKARFTPVQDATDSFTWTFTNESEDADSYTWDFGDGGTSTDASPSHTYTAEGTFTVTLTATGPGGTGSSSENILVVDPDSQLKKLTGEESKVWKLNRDLTNEQYPMQVGPADFSEIWWAYGLNEPIGSRECLMEEEYIFNIDGSFTYQAYEGTVYADFGVWNDDVAGGCVDENDAAAMTNPDGEDISAFGSGSFGFEYDAQAATLSVIGLGAHIALAKVGTEGEYTVPQQSVTYRVVELNTDGPVDYLTIETDLVAAGGYWRFVLVSYDDPADEPDLPGAPPSASFSSSIDESTVTFTNASAGADSYTWDFGDGNSSVEENPVHTYASDGIYAVKMTATNANGTAEANANVTISSSTFNIAKLHGNDTKTWKINPIAGALMVGPCQGCGDWFATSVDDITVRDCHFDDEYTFDTDGNFTYNATGSIWAEGYHGVDPAGCTDEAAIPSDAAAWTSGNHAFSVVESNGTDAATITVTGTGAFIGLSKAYNGGEYAAGPPVANGSVTYEVMSYVNDGTNEIITISVDISGTGGAFWTFSLIAN
ncbi:MAG: PKD domain-containing protein [Saprospiraceae bacterium]|nr:PKD domain-containing protein [Saprospiraceae bacterium]